MILHCMTELFQMYIDAAQDIENHRDLFTFRWVHDGALRTMFVENPPVPVSRFIDIV
jgi:hypothetical protein